MPAGLIKITTSLVLMLVLALAVASCGRRGALEAPPSSSVVTSNDGGDLQENPEPVEDKPFILDVLL